MPLKNGEKLVKTYPKIAITVDCAIFGFDGTDLKILLIKSDLEKYQGMYSLLGDAVHENEEVDNAANRVLAQRTGMTDIYLNQVKTFSNPNRHPGGRVITVAYCSLLNIKDHNLNITENDLHWHSVSSINEMAFDHKEILNYSLKWLQKMVQENPLAFNLLPEKFSLRSLQSLYESILGVNLDRRNFRKKFASMKLLIDCDEMEVDTPHRPGKLYQFNFEKYHQTQKNFIDIGF